MIRLAFICLVFASSALAQSTTPTFRPNDSLRFHIEKCVYSHPNFEGIRGTATGSGYNITELGPNHVLYNQPVRHPDTFFEVKEVQNGTGHCIAYNKKASLADAQDALNSIRQIQLNGYTTTDLAGGAGSSFKVGGLLYDLTLAAQPLKGGGAAVTLVVAGVTGDTKEALNIGGQSVNYRPNNDLASTMSLIARFYCSASIPVFENAGPWLRNTGATETAKDGGLAYRWPDRAFEVFLRNPSPDRDGTCSVTSTAQSMAEVNDIGRQIFKPGNTPGLEQDQPDGTRIWQSQGPDDINNNFGPKGTFGRSFVTTDGRGIGLEVIVPAAAAGAVLRAEAVDIDTPTGLLSFFVERCNLIDADPFAAVDGASQDSLGAYPPDRTTVIHTETIGQENYLEFRHQRLPDGQRSTCKLEVYSPGARYDTLPDLIRDNAGTLFGTEVDISGGPAKIYGSDGMMQVISTRQFPPKAMLTHEQSRQVVALNLLLWKADK